MRIKRTLWRNIKLLPVTIILPISLVTFVSCGGQDLNFITTKKTIQEARKHAKEINKKGYSWENKRLYILLIKKGQDYVFDSRAIKNFPLKGSIFPYMRNNSPTVFVTIGGKTVKTSDWNETVLYYQSKLRLHVVLLNKKSTARDIVQLGDEIKNEY